jgi:hypothetical protein
VRDAICSKVLARFGEQILSIWLTMVMNVAGTSPQKSLEPALVASLMGYTLEIRWRENLEGLIAFDLL